MTNKTRPPVKKSKQKFSATMAKLLCDFADDHDLVMNPKGYEHYMDGYLKENCCPCDDTRKVCPCPEALDEVKETGHCLCRLFWRSYKDFKEQMIA